MRINNNVINRIVYNAYLSAEEQLIQNELSLIIIKRILCIR